MTKTTFLLGAGIGFILGSRTGRDQVTLSGSTAAESHVTPPDPTPKSYADPQDLQFSTAAAQKEAMIDDLLEQGVPPAEMEQQEEELRQSGELSEPPAGNKAKPANGR
jgi:hypothetical protein